MANDAFKTFLTHFLDSLPRKADRRRHSFDDLAHASSLSRTTLYNWFKGAPATEERVAALARGLAKLEGGARNPELRGHDIEPPDDQVRYIKAELDRLLTSADDKDPPQPAFRFIAYPPICDLPSADSFSATAPAAGPLKNAIRPSGANWTFLGAVFGRFLSSSRQAVSEVSHCEITNLDQHDERQVLVGLFPTPERVRDWDFFRTPIQVPLNAVVLLRDVSAYQKHVLGTRRKRLAEQTPETFLSGLKAALWQFGAPIQQDLPGIREDLLPIVAEDEAGWNYLIDVHDFEKEELGKRVPRHKDGANARDAGSFCQALLSASEAFQKGLAPSGSEKGVIGKLPVIVADELTCLEVMRIITSTPEVSRKSDAILLADIGFEDLDPTLAIRPRFSPSLAFRREVGTDSSTKLSEEIRRSFDEFLWSNANAVAHQYLALYRDLLARYGTAQVLGPIAPLYLLRLLSLDVSFQEVDRSSGAASSGTPSTEITRTLAEFAEMGPWRTMLYTAKSLILRDRSLVQTLAATFAHDRLYSR